MNKAWTNGNLKNGLDTGVVNKTGGTAGKSGSEDGAPLVFVSLPRKKDVQANATRTLTGLPVYCERPPTARKRITEPYVPPKDAGLATAFAYRLLPLTVLLATVFAATGMFRVLVRGVSMPTYYPAGYLKAQSWRNGSGPSPLDAVKSDYQNALTREMVSAKDTGAGSKVAEKETKRKKTPETGINVSTSRYRGTAKKGLHNLTFKVFNGTNNRLDKVAVEVEFLDKHGRLLKSETFTTGDVAPQKEKEIVVPEGTPGVKVQYRISEVRSKSHTTLLQSI